jgi:hypothetical protein
MLTHYPADVLFSPAARQAFVESNIQSILRDELAYDSLSLTIPAPFEPFRVIQVSTHGE